MKIQNILPIFSLLVASTHAIANLRGGIERELQYYVDDNIYDYSNSTAVVSDDSSTAESTNNITDTMHQIQDIVTSQVQSYKVAAKSKGYEFYQTAPSEWTTDQWDFAMALFGGLILSCCFVSVCCAYCCIGGSLDDDADEAVTKAQYHGRMLNQKLDRYDDDDTIDDSIYTADSQSTYEESCYDTDTPKSFDSSVYISRREERECEEKKRTEERKKRAEAKRRDDERKRRDEERKKVEEKKRKDGKRKSLFEKNGKNDDKRESLLQKSSAMIVKVEDTSSRPSTSVRTTKSITPPSATLRESKEVAQTKAIEEALSYKIHP